MTEAEWDQHLAWLQTRWPDINWPPATVAACYQDLAGFSNEQVTEALGRLYASGRTFVPSPSEIYAAAREVRTEGARYGTAHLERTAIEGPKPMPGADYRELVRDGRPWADIIRGLANTRREDPT